MRSGDDARRAVADAGRRTVSRRELSRHDRFDEVSPEVGELDGDAFERYLDERPDDALSLLAEMGAATDAGLRELARRLAAHLALTMARRHSSLRRGIANIRPMPASRAVGDVDLDESLDAIVAARSSGRSPSVDDLAVSAWRRPDAALCLLIDRSGSMSGPRLAAAALAAAAVVYRQGDDCSVVAFSDQAIVVKAQGEHRSSGDIVSDLLALRGHGVTDVGLALRTARRELARSAAGRKVAILLSDCRVTQGGDASAHATGLDEIAIIAPADDTADAEALAEATGARVAPLAGPTGVPEAIARVLLG